MRKNEFVQFLGSACKQVEKITVTKFNKGLKLLNSEDSGCYIFKLVNHFIGCNFGVVIGFKESNNNREICVKLACHNEDNIVQSDYNRDWKFPIKKNGKQLIYEWTYKDIDSDLDNVINEIKDSIIPFFTSIYEDLSKE